MIVSRVVRQYRLICEKIRSSYHYLSPSDKIVPNHELTKLLKDCLERCTYQYTTGKSWTTDAIYRGTLKTINERKEVGCIAVDMKYSGVYNKRVLLFVIFSIAQFICHLRPKLIRYLNFMRKKIYGTWRG